ncbi:iron-sulfur cluster repair di-iron protein [Bacillus taeanensis]|uniref:Iron-sulfur cluster repair di-iron protein n=1 Tax=Bacillus taeanensis TaxID=273032 RepID=A0A366XQH1_9BACI|nr:iron-sulfur cluster repair di-iron protein [Bacillus taeanensis]RBW68362.1 iron-sulfur cluster repair di-iron protein [Bacillus taeanensis]
MEPIFHNTTKTGDIVTRLPETSTILKEYKIDFCCGGNRPIGEAIEEKNLNEKEILQKLNNVYFKSLQHQRINWDHITNSDLIDHIVNTHHAYLNAVLPELSQFTTKVFRVHGTHHPELADVHKLFYKLKVELEHHLIQEENIVFPLIREYEHIPSKEKLIELAQKIEDLESEHSEAGDLLKELRDVTNDYTLPEGACTTYRLTYQKLEDLESDLFQHIHLENNILFPRVLNELKEAN